MRAGCFGDCVGSRIFRFRLDDLTPGAWFSHLWPMVTAVDPAFNCSHEEADLILMEAAADNRLWPFAPGAHLCGMRFRGGPGDMMRYAMSVGDVYDRAHPMGVVEYEYCAPPLPLRRPI